METNIIKLMFLRNREPAGREYTYYTPEPVQVGDEVNIDIISDESISRGIVTQINVPYSEIEPFRDRAKTIIGKVVLPPEDDPVWKADAAVKQVLDF